MGEQGQPMMEREQAESEAAPRDEEVAPEGSVETGKEEKVVVTELSAPESSQTRPRGDAPALCALSSSWRMPDFPPYNFFSGFSAGKKSWAKAAVAKGSTNRVM